MQNAVSCSYDGNIGFLAMRNDRIVILGDNVLIGTVMPLRSYMPTIMGNDARICCHMSTKQVSPPSVPV